MGEVIYNITIKLNEREAQALKLILGNYTHVQAKELGLDLDDLNALNVIQKNLPYRCDDDRL